MISGLNRDHLAAIEEWANGQPDILSVWVFGSRAKGEASTQSDLDLAIVTPHNPVGKGLVEYAPIDTKMISDLKIRLGLPFPVDVQITSPCSNDNIVWPAVEDHGICVYKRP